MKQCSKCKKEKEIIFFWKRKRNKDGYESQCIECMSGKIPKSVRLSYELTHRHCNECNTLKPIHDFYHRKYYNKSIISRRICKSCELLKAKLNIHKKYKITKDELLNIHNKHNGCCHICNIKPKKIFIDHSHKTGKVRGVLCPKCNTALGMFNDDIKILKNAIEYLLN